MNDRDHDNTVDLILEVPEELATRLNELRAEFGDELLADFVAKALAIFQGKLALRGFLINKEQK
jgi:hypothetical protein